MNKNATNNPIIEAVDIIFKMRKDGRMDKEEACLFLDVIFSGHMDDEIFQIIKLIYKDRPQGGIADIDESEWETIADFSSMPGGGVRADELLKLLREQGVGD